MPCVHSLSSGAFTVCLCCTRISFTSSIAERCTTPGCPRPSTRWTRCRRLAELILSSTRSWVLFRPRTPVSKENSTRLQWRIMALVSRLMGAVGSSPSSNSSTGSLGSCPNIKKHGEESVAEFGVEFYAKISSPHMPLSSSLAPVNGVDHASYDYIAHIVRSPPGDTEWYESYITL